jgi:uncharacterized protein
MTLRRRFIAGAVCPQCREADRLVIETDDDQRLRRCVACGFSEAAPESSALVPSTRFTRSRGGAEDSAPVRIVDPTKPKT